jgi:nuclear transport factor 2 (NTF2) superfamily protein
MTLTREHAREVLGTYIRAWETQDADLICTIFTETATYHERVLGEPIPNRDAIREYWQTKVARDQANIRARVITFYLDEERDAVIAEWEAEFDDLAQGVRKRMREVAILEFDGPLIDSLREFWASEQLGKLEAAD